MIAGRWRIVEWSVYRFARRAVAAEGAPVRATLGRRAARLTPPAVPNGSRRRTDGMARQSPAAEAHVARSTPAPTWTGSPANSMIFSAAGAPMRGNRCSSRRARAGGRVRRESRSPLKRVRAISAHWRSFSMRCSGKIPILTIGSSASSLAFRISAGAIPTWSTSISNARSRRSSSTRYTTFSQTIIDQGSRTCGDVGGP